MNRLRPATTVLAVITVLAVLVACKAKKPDAAATSGSGSGTVSATAVDASGSGSATASGSGSDSTAAGGSGSSGSNAVSVDDGKPPAVRARALLVRQVELVKAGNSAELRAMFEPDAVILAPEPTAISSSLDLAARFTSTPKPADLALGEVVIGNVAGAIWIEAELTYGGNKKTRVVELLDGAQGWKIATASIATPKKLTASSGDPVAMPSPTDPGPLSKLLRVPSALSASFLESDPEDGDAPTIFAVGWESADRGIGYGDAKSLVYNLGKKRMVVDARVKSHEVQTATWSYALAILDVTTGTTEWKVVDGKPPVVKLTRTKHEVAKEDRLKGVLDPSTDRLFAAGPGKDVPLVLE